MRQRPADIRLALKAAGFAPVACIDKDAILPEWRNRRDATPEQIARWPGGNTGIDTKDAPCLDIDADDAEAAAGVEAAARDWFDGRGTIPVRFGRAPRVEHTSSKAEGGSGGTADPKPERRTRGTFVLHPFVPFDPMSLPPRQWLYGKHYQRRTVSATIAPGGVGKSSLDLVEAIAMATCRNLLGEQPEERLRVWYHNGEDNLDEIRRRICAICQHYGIPQTELAGWLWVTTGSEFPLRVAQGYSNLVINEALVRQISAAIADNGIDAAILDPLVTLHSVSEQDNNKMDAIIRIFFGIADAHDCAFELAHHTRKLPPGSTADYTMDDGRGASATGDALRAARVLNRMSPKDAEDAGVGEVERLSRFRVDRAKGNYSAPAAATTWRQFLSVTLPNGDEVGVVAPWDFPGQGPSTPEKAAAERKAEELFLRLLDKFAARGINVSANSGPTYAPAKFAGEREVKAAKISKTALKAAMDRLLDSGRIRSEAHDRDRYRLVREQPTKGGLDV